MGTHSSQHFKYQCSFQPCLFALSPNFRLIIQFLSGFFKELWQLCQEYPVCWQRAETWPPFATSASQSRVRVTPRPRRTLSPGNTQLSTTTTMQLLLELVVQDCVRLLDWSRKASKQQSSLNFSLLAPTLLPPRVVSMLLSATWSRTTGGGTCTIPLRAPTGWETRMPSTT